MQVDPSKGSKQSINSNTINVGGPDPIQGFDVGVFVQDAGRGHKDVLLGQFTSIQIRVIVAAEPYKAAGYDIPIYLDGEKQITFVLDKGLLDVNVFRETFGFKTYSWLNRYIRSPRFKITFAIDPVDFAAMDEACMAYGQKIQRTPSGRFVLEMAKINEWGIGSQAGKSVVVTQWQGVAQQIWAEPLTLNNMPIDKRGGYDAFGRPIDPIELPTFFFRDYADYASTSPRVTPDSYQLYPDWITPEMILNAEKQILLSLPDFPGRQALLDSIDRQLGQYRSAVSSPSSEALLLTAAALFPETRSQAINQFGSRQDLFNVLQLEKAAAQQLGRLGPTEQAVSAALVAVLDSRIQELIAEGSSSYEAAGPIPITGERGSSATPPPFGPVEDPRSVLLRRADGLLSDGSNFPNGFSEGFFGGSQGKVSTEDLQVPMETYKRSSGPDTPPTPTETYKQSSGPDALPTPTTDTRSKAVGEPTINLERISEERPPSTPE